MNLKKLLPLAAALTVFPQAAFCQTFNLQSVMNSGYNPYLGVQPAVYPGMVNQVAGGGCHNTAWNYMTENQRETVKRELHKEHKLMEKLAQSNANINNQFARAALNNPYAQVGYANAGYANAGYANNLYGFNNSFFNTMPVSYNTNPNYYTALNAAQQQAMLQRAFPGLNSTGYQALMSNPSYTNNWLRSASSNPYYANQHPILSGLRNIL